MRTRVSAGFGATILALCCLATPPVGAQTYEDEVVELVNAERWANGQLPPLRKNSQLDTSSETHSSNMSSRDFFAHCDLDDGTLPWDRMVTAGYNWNSAGENIAAGYSTPAAVMSGWMASSGHRANILSTNFCDIGVGYVNNGDMGNVRLDTNGDCSANVTDGPYYRYWTQNFGRRNGVYPVVIEREAYGTTSLGVDLYVYGNGWAVEMRIRNQGGAWVAWQPFASDVAWTLPAGNGTRVVEVEIKDGSGTVRSAADEIEVSGQNTTAAGDPPVLASGVLLHTPYPNPFRASSTISFELAEPGSVRLEVFDVHGRRVTTLVDEHRRAGLHESRWDGRSADGVSAAPGMYFLRLETAGSSRTTKLILRR